MRHEFPYVDFAPVEIPDKNIAGVYTLAVSPLHRSDEQIVRQALDCPIGSGRLRDEVKPGMKVVVAVDDNSRSTRTEFMLPMVLDEIALAGVPKQDVAVFIALGTHRPMTADEMSAKYTPQVVRNYRIINPHWKDSSAYIKSGQSADGCPINVHKEIRQADYVIGVGQTVPHMIAGFGGGGKIINPGCSDGQTIGQMHWLCSEVPADQIYAIRENAVRKVIDEVAMQAGLKFILNEVPGDGGMVGAFAGHPVAAHKKACECARQACRVRIARKADIVMADAYPADIDFWQALKGLNAAHGAVKKGGTIILVTPCPEGASSQHHELTKLGYSIAIDRIRAMVQAGTLDKAVGGNLFLGRQLLDFADAILVTKGISEKDTRAMGFKWARSPAAALNMALAMQGPAAKINVLYKAAKMICTLDCERQR